MSRETLSYLDAFDASLIEPAFPYAAGTVAFGRKRGIERLVVISLCLLMLLLARITAELVALLLAFVPTNVSPFLLVTASHETP